MLFIDTIAEYLKENHNKYKIGYCCDLYINIAKTDYIFNTSKMTIWPGKQTIELGHVSSIPYTEHNILSKLSEAINILEERNA